MRFLLRFFSLVCLAAASIAGTVDSIQSIAASAVVVTSLGDAWKGISPSSFERLESGLSLDDATRPYAPVIHWLLSQPAFAIFLAMALLVWMLAYRRLSEHDRFAA
jgi:hypothetical protein